MSDLIGKVVCGYRITTEIGVGGMGKVYLAESAFLTEYKQQVAIKTLTPYASNQRQAALLRDLFIREANIQVQLKHPHIVSVIQFAVEGDEHFLILEYVPGYQHQGRRIGSVADMIDFETGPVPHQRALKLFAQVLDAMSYAHGFRYRWEGEERVGLVHRDIKPGNLLFADAETVKVSDFGIVKVQHSGASMTTALTPGTSAYMSPEAILGPAHFGLAQLDARSDVYALGVTLYEMLAGRPPFTPEDGVNPDVSLRRKHVDQPPPPPSAFYSAIPAQLDRLVLRALEKNPERRYQTAAEFKQAILDFQGQAVPTKITALPEPVAPGAASHAPAATEVTPPKAGTIAAAAAQATAVMHSNRHTTPAIEISAPPAAEQLTAPPDGSSRARYFFIAALLLSVGLAVAAVMIKKHYADAAAEEEAAPVSQPSASPGPARSPAGMVLIPGGSFKMGRDLSEAEKKFVVSGDRGTKTEVFAFDYPAHEAQVAPFYLDVTEVPNREYASFVRATGHTPPAGWSGGEPPRGAEDLPVTGVSYRDAVEYCAWRTTQRKDGLTYRLPTEEEWEFAARGAGAGERGPAEHLYPWGDEWREGLANTKESRLGHPQIVTANRAGATAAGVLNLSGNVAEWTATDFNHYPGSDRATPREEGYAGTYQVVRGGSFDYPKEWAMSTTRAWARPTDKGPSIGFRCAADAKR